MRIDQAASAIKPQTSSPSGKTKESGDDFGRMLMDAIKDVDGMQKESLHMQNNLMAGRPVDPASLMIAMNKASTAMSLTLQVRNKLLESYQEISRMNV